MSACFTLRPCVWNLLVFVTLLGGAPNSPADIVTGFFTTPVPGPRGDATVAKPMVWVFTQPKAGGGTEEKTVTITNLPKRAANETVPQAANRKADLLVTEFNTVLGAGRAEKVMVAGKPTVKIFGLSSGTDANNKPVQAIRLLPDPTLQAGNGGRFQQGSGGKMSMGAIMEIDSNSYAATGVGPDGEPAVVEFGVEGVYIASVNPSPGSSPLSILAQLSSVLGANGILNTFDPGALSLTLDPLYDSDLYNIYWTSSDEGLPFGVGVFAVPEPGSC